MFTESSMSDTFTLVDEEEDIAPDAPRRTRAGFSNMMEVSCVAFKYSTKELECLRAFLQMDWKGTQQQLGFGDQFLRRFQRALLVQLSILVLFAYLRLHEAKEDSPSILTGVVTFFLYALSLIVIPYALYVTIDFLYFVVILYIGHGVIVRYPTFRKNEREFEQQLEGVGTHILNDSDEVMSESDIQLEMNEEEAREA